MPGKPSRTSDVTDVLMEAQALIRDALLLMQRATTVAQERELHVKHAIDALRHGEPTRDLAKAYREMKMPLETEASDAAD